MSDSHFTWTLPNPPLLCMCFATMAHIWSNVSKYGKIPQRIIQNFNSFFEKFGSQTGLISALFLSITSLSNSEKYVRKNLSAYENFKRFINKEICQNLLKFNLVCENFKKTLVSNILKQN